MKKHFCVYIHRLGVGPCVFSVALAVSNTDASWGVLLFKKFRWDLSLKPSQDFCEPRERLPFSWFPLARHCASTELVQFMNELIIPHSLLQYLDSNVELSPLSFTKTSPTLGLSSVELYRSFKEMWVRDSLHSNSISLIVLNIRHSSFYKTFYHAPCCLAILVLSSLLFSSLSTPTSEFPIT